MNEVMERKIEGKRGLGIKGIDDDMLQKKRYGDLKRRARDRQIYSGEFICQKPAVWRNAGKVRRIVHVCTVPQFFRILNKIYEFEKNYEFL